MADIFVQKVKTKLDGIYKYIRLKKAVSQNDFIIAIHECKSWFWARDDLKTTFGVTQEIYYAKEITMDTERTLNIIRQHILPLLSPFAGKPLPDQILTAREGNRTDTAGTLNQLVSDMQNFFAPRPSGTGPPGTVPQRARLAVLAAMRAQLSSIKPVVVLCSPLIRRQGASYL